MKRKIVKQGAATLMISLPSKWARQFNLKKGDEIDILEEGNTIIISPEHKSFVKETRIKLSGETEATIRTVVTNSYRKGFDRVIVSFNTEDQFKIMQKVVRDQLLGFEIIKREKNHCYIENITEPSEDQFENILQKVFYNIAELFVVTEETVEKRTISENYEDIERRIVQYDNFCRRVIAKRRGEKDSQLFWAFLTAINHGQREIYHLNKDLGNHKIKYTKEIVSLLREAKGLFDRVYEIYTKKDSDELQKFFGKERDLLHKKGYALLEKEPRVLYRLLSSIRNTYLAASPLTGLID